MASDKILIFVEKNSDFLKEAAATLSLADYEIRVAKTQDELIELAGVEPPDLILKDVGEDADFTVDFISSFITDEKRRRIPIVIAGSFRETSIRVVEALNAGAAAYIKIPAEPLILVRDITRIIERKRNEKLIGNHENYLRALIENGSDIITVIDEKGTIIYESPSIEPLLGYKSKELIGKYCLKFVHNDDRQAVSEYYREGLRQKGFVQLPLKYRFKHKNGSWRVLESVCNFIETENEELVIIVNSRDITRRRSEEKARRRLENKLIEAEKMLKFAMQTARMVWWEWDPKQNQITHADNFPKVYGVQNVSLAQDGFSLVHPEDRAYHTNLVQKIAETGKPYKSEFRVIRSDNGKTVWLEESATALFDEEGKVKKVVGIAVDITERKKAEKSLRESEERFKSQYKGLPVPAYTWKKSGDDFILHDFNNVADNLAQNRLSEYLGRTATEVFPDLPQLYNAIMNCFERKKAISFEMAYPSRINKDVKQLIFSLVFIPKDFVMIYTLDVTEFRQIINSLKTSESRFHLVARATNDVLWDWNLVNDDLWCNENVFRVFGYPEEDISPNINFRYENIHPSDAEKIINGIKKVIETGQNFWSGEYRFRQGNGSYAYVFDRAYVERDDKGQAIRMIGAMMNITSRKWAEIELLESKERLSIAQQVANIGSFDFDIQTRKLITSRQLEEIYGAEPNFNHDFDYWQKFIHPDDVGIVQEGLTIAQDAGEFNCEFRIFSADGELHWLQCHLKSFVDENNRPQRIVGVNMDITQRKISEEALRKSQEQLAQSQKLESVGRLAGGIAHDFNNMLTAINGYSELILRSINEDSSIRRKVLEIKKAGERSAELTNQLLAFSRRQILQPKLVDLNQIILDMSQLLSRLIREDIQLKIELNEDACCVMADPGQVSQVIMNLVVNSRDAMPEGGSLKIRTSEIRVDKNYASKHSPMATGEYIVLNVEDSGIGIDSSSLQHIFEPFFTTKRSGNGLGLSTVYGIVKQSNGYIWVDSEKSKGTSFSIFLPHVKERAVSQKNVSEEKYIAKGHERILLVEDEESVRKLLSQILQVYGYSVIEAANGIQALKLCEESKPEIDLLLTDIVMPKMGGYRLSEELSKISPHIKILYMSGYLGDKPVWDNKIIPDQKFISKPIAPAVLAEKVRFLLDANG